MKYTEIKTLVKNSLYYMERMSKDPLHYNSTFNGLLRDSIAYYAEQEDFIMDN